MKTWEMIKELTENPDKKFRHKGDTTGCYVTVEQGHVIWLGEEQIGQKMSVALGEGIEKQWEEVKEPVDFMTAVKSGKKILFPDLCVEEEYLPLDVLLKEIASNYYVTEIITAITNGKFYTED